MHIFTYEFVPRFADTDAAGLIHFAKILCYAEEAEHETLREMGYPINPADASRFQWPRVACSAEYIRPLEAFHTYKINLTVKRLGQTSITWYWEIHRDNHTCARGELKTVCCRIVNSRIETGPIPDELRAKLSG